LNHSAAIETVRPKRESCSVSYIAKQDSRSMIEAKRFDHGNDLALAAQAARLMAKLLM
jgi:hypothetical protein